MAMFQSLRIVFMGTPEFAVASLKKGMIYYPIMKNH